ncbi:hypothetical protein OROHE_003639 [Orobanche hederae]
MDNHPANAANAVHTNGVHAVPSVGLANQPVVDLGQISGSGSSAACASVNQSVNQPFC